MGLSSCWGRGGQGRRGEKGLPSPRHGCAPKPVPPQRPPVWVNRGTSRGPTGQRPTLGVCRWPGPSTSLPSGGAVAWATPHVPPQGLAGTQNSQSPSPGAVDSPRAGHIPPNPSPGAGGDLGPCKVPPQRLRPPHGHPHVPGPLLHPSTGPGAHPPSLPKGWWGPGAPQSPSPGAGGDPGTLQSPPPPPLGRYVGLVDHALAEGEVGVGQVGERLQQDLGRDGGLEEGGVELVPGGRAWRKGVLGGGGVAGWTPSDPLDPPATHSFSTARLASRS